MKNLIYIPIIHSGADMGSTAAGLTQKSINEFGKNFWETHIETINKYWDIISQYCDTINFGDHTIKIYQDGMIADSEIADKIIEDSVKAGSKNYEIISKILKRGAVIVQTEELSMVKKELKMLKSIPSSNSLFFQLIRIFKFKINRSKLLKQRDKYIANRITATLDPNDLSIIFIGAYHKVSDKLPKDIVINELKGISKIRGNIKKFFFSTTN